MQFVRKLGETLRDLQQWRDAERYLTQYQAFFEEALASDPGDMRTKYDLVVIYESIMRLYELQGKTERALSVSQRIVSLTDDRIRNEPANEIWHMSRGYYRYKLGTQLARVGDRDRALSAGRQGLSELMRVADLANSPPQALEQASEAFALIEPSQLRNGERALNYAERFAKLRPAEDVSALYLLAFAQHAAGANKEAIETARRALALLPPSSSSGVYYVRTELESIR